MEAPKVHDKPILALLVIIVFFLGFSFGRLFPNTQYYYIVSEYQGPEWEIQAAYANQTQVGIAFTYQFTVNPHHEGWRSWTEYRKMGIYLNDTGHFETGIVWIVSEPPEALNFVEVVNGVVVGYEDHMKFTWQVDRINATYFNYQANIWFGVFVDEFGMARNKV